MTSTRRQGSVRTAAEFRALHMRGSIGKIAGDPALRAYVNRHLKKSTFADLAAKCRERFGAERAPSKSAIGRYWHRTQAGK